MSAKCEQCIVRELSSLKALNKEELLRMAECKSSYEVKKGDPLFEEGEMLNGIYCVKDGVAKMSKLSANGKDQIVKLVKKGELLGQRSLISEEAANLSAVAIEDMQVCFIPKAEVLKFFNENNQFSLNMMKSVCGDLREADDHMVDMAQKTVKQRLAHTLLHLEKDFGTNEDGSLKIQLSREEIAGMIGTATESCIRLLSEFNKEGLIELSGKKIILVNKNMLQKMSE
ncbi:Probable transcriptional regulatory protein, Crp/Fnr family [Flavobacterium indicum GPTSA100-9 = DSM 17447]|uniref:Probable transcriptional regulatory protein, Crp/Fnr family n=1 Tax=Flavobacterium indicum (strain DSM 17447 / CIP 109464 / GPTSA100-9) TaxID=1094466 RepID=H8XVE4_FLAIG|nr:Crp/Fnr family transcriptional regulator [Flavobacterium indicum]CCG53114.1 Probable transcriptional regulatory protein, Crp/Fnr family [Flavobacterium indicum GPTSA100-9 = DSM 17447]